MRAINEYTKHILVFCAAFLFGLSLARGVSADEVKSRKIVVFQDWFTSIKAQDDLLGRSGALKLKTLKLINGVVVDISSQTKEDLKANKEILRIDDDLMLHAQQMNREDKKEKDPQPDQEITWNIFMTGANLAWAETEGQSIKVAICDTGIDLDHPDLTDNIAADINFIKPQKSGDDDSGHGTHVAGIVAAADNQIGVVGMGPKISLYAVKVLDKQGRGWLSDLIDALDWCIASGIQVINMSFGTLQDNLSFHEAVQRVYDAGIVQIAAAGNYGEEGGDISYPARYPETIAVSAVDQAGNFASFSSYGGEIDLTAPGVEIWSSYENGGYQFLSGTSMSAPHVTGTAALILTTSPRGSIDENKNGLWDPPEIKNRLMLTAQNLGLAAEKQGSGLVRADEALK